MKQLFKLFLLSIIVAACSAPQAEENTYPEDLAGKQTLLREKRAELQELTSLIERLENDIIELDPTQSAAKRLVTTTSVGKTDFQHFVEIQAAVEADDLIDVTAETPGILTKMSFKEGDYIKKGQLVARLDLEQLNKQMAELEKSKELADIVYERQKRLWDQNIGSEIQFLEAKNGKERIEKSIESLQFQMTKSEVYSPVSGVVERVNIESGELVSPGVPILQVLNTNKLKVVADVPENLIRAVKRGDVVTIQYPALNEERQQRVSLIGRTIDPANRTFEVEVNVDNMGGLLKPNLLATMLINDYTETDVIIIPLDAIQQEVGGTKYVYVVDQGKDGLVTKKIVVRTGESYRGDIIITEGLTGTEELILEGARGAADKEPIQIVNQKTEAVNG
ncbi:MAG: efflux RND transporter periplasmic adaptor subunit [Bacteroidota bacterium]